MGREAVAKMELQMTPNTQNQFPAENIELVTASELCPRCRFRTITVLRGFRFDGGIRYQIRRGEQVCSFCK